MDWCIDELQYKAKFFEETGAVNVYNGDVVKSDTAIPSSLKEQLKRTALPLEQVPAKHQDWHPGSDNQVLDLVHPSLFPLVYGQTRILPDALTTFADFVEKCGAGVVASVPPEKEATFEQKIPYYSSQTLKDPYSRKFQWLPCEVDISGNDNTR